MLLHDEDEAARDDAHAHPEEEADGLDGVVAQAHVREALVGGEDAEDEAEGAVGGHEVEVAGLVGHRGQDGHGRDEEAVAVPEHHDVLGARGHVADLEEGAKDGERRDQPPCQVLEEHHDYHHDREDDGGSRPPC